MSWLDLIWLIPLVIGATFGGAWIGMTLPPILWAKKTPQFEVPFPVGYIQEYCGDDIPAGWIVADGGRIGNQRPETKALYFLLWDNAEGMMLQFKKTESAEKDWNAGTKIPIPHLGGSFSDRKYKGLIKL